MKIISNFILKDFSRIVVGFSTRGTPVSVSRQMKSTHDHLTKYALIAIRCNVTFHRRRSRFTLSSTLISYTYSLSFRVRAVSLVSHAAHE